MICALALRHGLLPAGANTTALDPALPVILSAEPFPLRLPCAVLGLPGG